MPKIEGENQKLHRYDLKECLTWFIHYKVSLTKTTDLRKAQTRKLNLESDKLEIELLEKRNQVVHISKIIKVWSLVISEFKIRMMTIPKSVSALFDIMNSSHDLELTLTKAIHEALDELSRAESLQNTIMGLEENETIS